MKACDLHSFLIKHSSAVVLLSHFRCFLETHAKQCVSSDTSSKLNNLPCFHLPILPSANLKAFHTLGSLRQRSNKRCCQLTRWKNILLIFALPPSPLLCCESWCVQTGPGSQLAWGKPDTRQAAADMMSLQTAGKLLWCHFPLPTALTPWRGVGERGAQGERLGRGRWALDEKKHWCVDWAALVFSLMWSFYQQPELSAMIRAVRSAADDKVCLSMLLTCCFFSMMDLSPESTGTRPYTVLFIGVTLRVT